jgi:hypothetical protein
VLVVSEFHTPIELGCDRQIPQDEGCFSRIKGTKPWEMQAFAEAIPVNPEPIMQISIMNDVENGLNTLFFYLTCNKLLVYLENELVIALNKFCFFRMTQHMII